MRAESFVVLYGLQLEVITRHPKIIEGANWHCYSSNLGSDSEKLNFVCRLQMNKVMGNAVLYLVSFYLYARFVAWGLCSASVILSSDKRQKT